MVKKTDQDTVTEAGAVELDEGALDQAHGGFNFLKLDDKALPQGLGGTFGAAKAYKIEFNGIQKVSPPLKRGKRI
ncbi:MAG: hypothetical protein AAF501_20515 [Pseudomonadota bacterium]